MNNREDDENLIQGFDKNANLDIFLPLELYLGHVDMNHLHHLVLYL